MLLWSYWYMQISIAIEWLYKVCTWCIYSYCITTNLPIAFGTGNGISNWVLLTDSKLTTDLLNTIAACLKKVSFSIFNEKVWLSKLINIFLLENANWSSFVKKFLKINLQGLFNKEWAVLFALLYIQLCKQSSGGGATYQIWTRYLVKLR